MGLDELQELESIGDSVGGAKAFHQNAKSVIIALDATGHHVVSVKAPGNIDVVLHQNIENGIENLERWCGGGAVKLGDQVRDFEDSSEHTSTSKASCECDKSVVIGGRAKAVGHFVEQLLDSIEATEGAELVDKGTVG